MMPFTLDFVSPEDQRTCFSAIFDGVDPSDRERTQACALAQIGDFVGAYGAGRVPVILYVGLSSWLVLLVTTNPEKPGVRLVERVYVFRNPANPDIARTVTATMRDLVEDVKRLSGDERAQQRRKLHHLAAVIDPNLVAMFGCVADRRAQEIILRQIEHRAELASQDATVSATSTLLRLSKLLGIFRSRRNPQSANEN